MDKGKISNISFNVNGEKESEKDYPYCEFLYFYSNYTFKI